MTNEQIASDLKSLRDALTDRLDSLLNKYDDYATRPSVVQSAVMALGEEINELDDALTTYEEHGAFEMPERKPASLDHRTSAPGGR